MVHLFVGEGFLELGFRFCAFFIHLLWTWRSTWLCKRLAIYTAGHAVGHMDHLSDPSVKYSILCDWRHMQVCACVCWERVDVRVCMLPPTMSSGLLIVRPSAGLHSVFLPGSKILFNAFFKDDSRISNTQAGVYNYLGNACYNNSVRFQRVNWYLIITSNNRDPVDGSHK